MTPYQEILDWLIIEPDTDLIIPTIKEDIAANKYTPLEIDALRSRVMFIKKNGHAKYLKATPVEILQEISPEAMVVRE